MAELEDELRFRQARPGDHVSTPFQCPNCQSQNIRGKDLTPGEAGSEAFECLCTQAQLDAFWSHSSRTVRGHVSEVRFTCRYAEQLGIRRPFPALGPFKLGAHLGMLTAVLVLRRSIEPGRGGREYVKYGTARGARTIQTVVWESSPESGADVVLSSASIQGRYVATENPTEGRWYQFFALGCSARMGDVVHQDRAYSIEVLLKLVEMYEHEWDQHGYAISGITLRACLFLLLTCLGGMRGYEAVWTDLAALRYDLTYCENRGDESAVAWPIVGRFKSQHGRAGCYMIPIAGTTKSGIRFFRWTQRFVTRLAMEGLTEGWAFQRPGGARAKAHDYWDDIAGKLEVIQRTTSLIDPECDVWNDYGAQRSGRRCLTTHCTNVGIPPHLVEVHNRWSTDRAAGVRTVTRSMIHTYSEMRNMKDSLIKPSRAF